MNDSDIRRRLEAVRRHQLDVFDFGDWLDSESWNLHKNNPASFRLASAIHRMFSEYDYHHSERVLRGELLSLLSDPQVVVMVRFADDVRLSNSADWFGSVNSVAEYLQPAAV